MKIEVEAELIMEIESKSDWINNVPDELPKKIGPGEVRVWIDKNGNAFRMGEDFSLAETHSTYPCKVYRLISVKRGNPKTSC